MAEMLVDSTKLDACLDAEADAIRAKTGDSNDLTFDFANNKGFADAIAAIPSGGGNQEYHLLYDTTLEEEVDTIRIDFDAQMQKYKVIYILADSPANSPTYPYIRVNSTTNGSYNGSPALSEASIMPNPIDDSQGRVVLLPYTTFTYPISFIYFAKYYATQKFQVGTRIRLFGWG